MQWAAMQSRTHWHRSRWRDWRGKMRWQSFDIALRRQTMKLNSGQYGFVRMAVCIDWRLAATVPEHEHRLIHSNAYSRQCSKWNWIRRSRESVRNNTRQLSHYGLLAMARQRWPTSAIPYAILRFGFSPDTFKIRFQTHENMASFEAMGQFPNRRVVSR